MKFSAVIPAAGLSSRMGAFKPLLEINGFPMISMTVNSLKNAGVSHIVCVSGLRGDEIAAALSASGVSIIHNPDYSSTDMLHSVKLGLAQCENSDAVFVLPGDMPLVSPGTVFKMKQHFEKHRPDVLFPLYKGRRAHPVLLSQKTAHLALAFSGSGGLRALLDSIGSETINCGNPGALLDADTAEAFAGVKKYARSFRALSPAMCLSLLAKAQTPAHIVRHCLAVADLSLHMAQALITHGYCIDSELCYSGAALHDIMRLSPNHHLAGATYLRSEGYDAVSDIVAQHYGFVGGDIPPFNEWSIVCLADKLVREDERVSIAERYAPACAKFPADTYIGARVRNSMRICSEMCKTYQLITGESLE